MLFRGLNTVLPNFAKTLLSVFVLILLLGQLPLKAQYQLVNQFNVDAKAVFMDHLDQIYVLRTDAELLKYNTKGQLLARYNNKRYGPISGIDVSDPLRVKLFYSNFQQLVLLDNRLTQLGNRSFANIGFTQVQAIATSSDQSLWLFDYSTQQLIKLNVANTVEARSANLSQLLGQMLSARQLFADDDFLYLLVQDGLVYQFDRFGAFIATLPIGPIDNLAVRNQSLFFVKNSVIQEFGLKENKQNNLQMPALSAVSQVAVGNKFIAVLAEKAVFLLAK